MVVLFSSAALVEAFRLTSLSSLTNCDIWWHLSSGLWILQNHAFPRNGLFSQASGQAWSASSWGYDVLLATAYKALGLRAIPFFLMCFRVGLAVLTFLLAGGMRGRFWPAVGLSATAQYVLGAVPPGPAYFSILLSAIELLLLMETRRRGSVCFLWWLAPLFLAWTNLHVQFVYGVVVLLLFLSALAIEKSSDLAEVQGLSLAGAAKVIGVAIVATVFTPYLWGPYGEFFRTALSSGNRYLPEFEALGFRQAQDYLLLLLGMSAFLALGLRRSRDVFQIALLGGCLGLSFYARRDIWLVAVASLAVIGNVLASESAADSEKEEAKGESRELVGVAQEVAPAISSLPQRLKPQSSGGSYGTSGTRALPKTRRSDAFSILIAAGCALGVVVFVFGVRMPRGQEALLAKAGVGYPVAACDYVRGHRLAQPLFNAYEWGGFLTWYLPEYPVAIDSRADLYGGDAIAAYSNVMNAEVRFTEYPALANAQTIVLPKNANMAVALASVPRFQVAYSDDVAVVLSRRDEP
jgi:hypothetical protein